MGRLMEEGLGAPSAVLGIWIEMDLMVVYKVLLQCYGKLK